MAKAKSGVVRIPAADSGARRRRSDSEASRRRVIDAAVECILEIGYYKTSTNEIARRAGVTWGTLQYQFGTRDALLIEVVNDRWHQLQAAVSEATITGETLEERLVEVLDVLDRFYGKPAHLAHIQILLDLIHSPDTSAELRQAVADHGRQLVLAWRPLFVAALGPVANEADLVRYAYVVLRAYLVGRVISGSLADIANDRTTRALLVQGVAATIRAQAGERGIELSQTTPSASRVRRTKS